MKKFIGLLVCLMMVFGLSLGTFTAFAAEEEDLTPNFSDNFDSYEVSGSNFIEDDPAIRKNWENELMLNIDGNEMAAHDSECKGKAKIIEDPTGGPAGNKVLHIKNYDPIGSFFYMGPKGLRVRDFELSYKIYVNRSAQEPWVGVSVRKDNNVRFNGCNNMLFTYKSVEDTSRSPVRELMYLSIMRGYAGVGNPQDKTKDLDTYDKDNPGNQLSNYEGSEYVAANNTMKTWVTVTYKAITKEDGSTDYSSSITTADGVEHYIGTLNYKSKSVDAYGYVSLNACIADAYIDDVHLENLDEEPAPTLKATPSVIVTISDVKDTEASFSFDINDPDGAMDGLGLEYFEFVNQKDENDLVMVSDYNATKVTGLTAGTTYKMVVYYSYDISDGNGKTMGSVTSKEFTTTGGSGTVKPGDDKPNPEPSKGGCKSSVAATGIAGSAIALAAATAAVLCLGKKKD